MFFVSAFIVTVELTEPQIFVFAPAERPMRIEIVVDPSRPAPPPSLAARVAPAATTATTETSAARPRVGRVGRPGPRRGGGVRKNERPAKSAADLDAEMEDYTASNAPAAA